MPVKGSYLLVAGGGVIVLWSGIRGHKWSSVLRDIISGKKLPTTTELAIETAPGASNTSGAGIPAALPAGGSAAKNKAIARILAAPYGWATGANWAALVRLWDRESGWNAKAQNPSSGAAGIPQDITGNFHGGAAGQITWGLKYIKQRYGSPVAAWNHETSQGWY